jgi:hypothetical protein
MSIAGAASAANNQCVQILWWDFCPATPQIQQLPPTVSAPEIDPSSAMAGLTLMLGGLAVMRGRRAKITKK